MRRLSLFLFILLLVPSAAFGAGVAAGDGSLAVSGASARIIVVVGSGLIYGHIDQGTLTVFYYRPVDTSTAQVSGTITKAPVGTATLYSGSDIRFLLPNGRYWVRMDGSGIDISGVGKGTVSAIGAGTGADGAMTTNGGKALPLGVTPTTLVFGGGNAPNTSPTSAAAKSSTH
jgi:hypothetical protein